MTDATDAGLAARTPWRGGQITEHASVVLCENPGPMTLDGTNTWVLHSPSAGEVIVVDPGPLDEQHLQAVLSHVRSLDARVALTLFTHGHYDHVESADRWAQLTDDAPQRGAARGEDLLDDERITLGELTVRVMSTPGHTSDSVSFVVESDDLLLTGDTVLGRGTSIVAHPDGQLAAYLDSLDRLQRIGSGLRLGPGHGPTHDDAGAVVASYIAHRHERLDQVRAALAAGAAAAPDPVEAVVETVYADVPRTVWPAARATVRAQLDYLAVR